MKKLTVLAVATFALSTGAMAEVCAPSIMSAKFTNSDGSANGYSCTILDKVYSNFAYVNAGSDPTADDIDIGIDSHQAIAQTGLQFQSHSGNAWTTPGFTFSYTATIDQDLCQSIYGSSFCTMIAAQGSFQDGLAPSDASMTMTLTQGGTVAVDDLDVTHNTRQISLSGQPLTTVDVVIRGTGAGTTDPIESFGLDIYQSTATPEPATTALLLGGLVGIGLMGRKRLTR